MGGFSSKNFSGVHLIHFTQFYENKLYVYVPEHDHLYSFNIFQKGRKFRFFAQESISTNKGGIYLVGGQTLSAEDEDANLDPMSLGNHLKITNFVAKINLNKHENYSIDIDRLKPCRWLPDPRTAHLLVYSEPYIFVIGGYYEQNISTKSCLRFHTKKRVWEQICDIGFNTVMTEPSGLAVNNEYIYVFETAIQSNLPRVHKYSIQNDIWSEIIFQNKNKDLKIPPTLCCSVFHIADKELLILSGMRMDSQNPHEEKGFYYIFNIETEQITDYKDDKIIDYWRKDRQGDVDYRKMQSVFARGGDGVVRELNKTKMTWTLNELSFEEIRSETNNCCARGK